MYRYFLSQFYSCFPENSELEPMENTMNTMTLTLGVMGEHIENSLSPFIHMNFIRYYSLNYLYLPFQIKSGHLEKAIKGAIVLGIQGLNITIPFKEKAMVYMDEIDSVARGIGAINTIVIKKEKLYGYNTDRNGFVIPLKAEMNIHLNMKRVVVLGAGGAARAVIFSLAGEGCSAISVFNRNEERASRITKQYKDIFPQCKIKSFPYQGRALLREIKNADLLVNTTPLGSWYYPGQNPLMEKVEIPSKVIVYDLIYYPDRTPLLYHAERNGNRILNGLPMLVYQAAESFYLWTGIYPDQEIIGQTLRQLKQKEKLE